MSNPIHAIQVLAVCTHSAKPLVIVRNVHVCQAIMVRRQIANMSVYSTAIVQVTKLAFETIVSIHVRVRALIELSAVLLITFLFVPVLKDIQEMLSTIASQSHRNVILFLTI